ncbi:hypothetical protein CRG98_019320 [Punica granatum]|uniref:Uncharacterized protein n=1 Tax=Punica granatum TaxID=22663 RepID=A0A2I0JVG0_PUNGR|nr:hypothetical protein CRG98_019320 [Punica granatum]
MWEGVSSIIGDQTTPRERIGLACGAGLLLAGQILVCLHRNTRALRQYQRLRVRRENLRFDNSHSGQPPPEAPTTSPSRRADLEASCQGVTWRGTKRRRICSGSPVLNHNVVSLRSDEDIRTLESLRRFYNYNGNIRVDGRRLSNGRVSALRRRILKGLLADKLVP